MFLIVGLAPILALAMEIRETGIVSPDKKCIAYTTAACDEGTGSILYVRKNQTNSAAVRLMQNSRWIDASWSPDSRFLAVIYGLDGHITDIYVYGLSLSSSNRVDATLYYHTPHLGTYDTKWTLDRWVDNQTILLTKEVKTEFPGTITRTNILVRMDSQPKLEMRKFTVKPTVFHAVVDGVGNEGPAFGVEKADANHDANRFFEEFGIPFPKGTSAKYDEASGTATVTHTPDVLDQIQDILTPIIREKPPWFDGLKR